MVVASSAGGVQTSVHDAAYAPTGGCVGGSSKPGRHATRKGAMEHGLEGRKRHRISHKAPQARSTAAVGAHGGGVRDAVTRPVGTSALGDARSSNPRAVKRPAAQEDTVRHRREPKIKSAIGDARISSPDQQALAKLDNESAFAGVVMSCQSRALTKPTPTKRRRAKQGRHWEGTRVQLYGCRVQCSPEHQQAILDAWRAARAERQRWSCQAWVEAAREIARKTVARKQASDRTPVRASTAARPGWTAHRTPVPAIGSTPQTTAVMPIDPPGSAEKEKLSGFKVIRCIGKGSYGAVYKARMQDSQCLVAVKVQTKSWLHATRTTQQSREIAVLRELSVDGHPRVLRLLGWRETHFNVQLLRELMDEDLRAYIKGTGIEVAVARRFSHDLTSALEYVHGREIVHRDLKPANIFVRHGQPLAAVLGDFGCARKCEYAAGRPMTEDVCTLWYRAPEVLLSHDRYDRAMDLWSLGVTCTEMETGKAPFRASSAVGMILQIFSTLGTPVEMPRFGVSCCDLPCVYLQAYTATVCCPSVRVCPRCRGVDATARCARGLSVRS